MHYRKTVLATVTGLALAFAGFAAHAEESAKPVQMPPTGTYGVDTHEQGNPVAVLKKAGKKKCKGCASVTRVEKVEKERKASGLGAIGGAVAGGVLGHQVGSGRGKTLATIAGAGGGAYLGNEVEKRFRDKKMYWDVVIKRDSDGSERSLEFPDEPVYKAGDRVRITYKQ